MYKRCILKRCHGVSSAPTRGEKQDIEEVKLIDESDDDTGPEAKSIFGGTK